MPRLRSILQSRNSRDSITSIYSSGVRKFVNTTEANCEHIKVVLMPRASKAQERSLPVQTLVVDNGGYSIKAAFALDTASEDASKVIPNCVARDRGKRIWVGSQLERCTDFGEIAFRRPMEKGFVVNWEAEKAIWDDSFINKGAALQACKIFGMGSRCIELTSSSAIPQIQI